MSRLPIVKLLGKPGCCGCDPAKFVLQKIKQRIPFEGKVVNILREPQYEHFKNEIPVILVDEKVICSRATKIIENDIYEAIKAASQTQL